MILPKTFKERYSALVDDEAAFLSCLDSLLPKSFRVNTLKTNAKHVQERFEGYRISLTPVPWSKNAFISSLIYSFGIKPNKTSPVWMFVLNKSGFPCLLKSLPVTTVPSYSCKSAGGLNARPYSSLP